MRDGVKVEIRCCRGCDPTEWFEGGEAPSACSWCENNFLPLQIVDAEVEMMIAAYEADLQAAADEEFERMYGVPDLENFIEDDF